MFARVLRVICFSGRDSGPLQFELHQSAGLLGYGLPPVDAACALLARLPSGILLQGLHPLLGVL